MDNTVTPQGTRIEGAFENERNAKAANLFKSIIRHVFGVQDVIVGHHLVYVAIDKDANGFEIQVVEEIPSADALIFDHGIAQKLWPDDWRDKLTQFALTPADARDELLLQHCAHIMN